MAEDDSQFSYSQRSTQMQTVLFENATDIKVQLTLCVCVCLYYYYYYYCRSKSFPYQLVVKNYLLMLTLT